MTWVWVPGVWKRFGHECVVVKREKKVGEGSKVSTQVESTLVFKKQELVKGADCAELFAAV